MTITREELIIAISKLKKSTGFGPDQIPALLISKCSNCLLDPIMDLFSSSLREGYFPQTWRQCFIRPLHKKGIVNNVKNYRPIATNNALSKLFDSIVTNKLSLHLHPLISIVQHGFMPSRSTETNLAIFTDFIFKSFSQHDQVDAFFSDFSKAFDSVNHALLARKLENYGVKGKMLEWIESYLTGRTAQIKVKNYKSEPFEIVSGVPQGSHLGPLLFILFIDDIKNVIKHSQILLFADDAKIYKEIKSIDDSIALQRDIIAMAVWCARNALDLNLDKCFIINFYNNKNPKLFDYKVGNCVLNNTESTKDLGVMLDYRLNFKSHIDYVSSKAIKIIGFIKKFTADFNDISSIIYLYKALALPTLLYASPIWSPHQVGDSYRLESLQHIFLRYLCFKVGHPMDAYSHDYTEAETFFKLPTLKSTRCLRDAIFSFKLIHRLVDCDSLCDKFVNREMPYELRSHRQFEETVYRANYVFHSITPRLLRTWHSLPQDLQGLDNLNVFKNLCKLRFCN